MSKMRFQKLWDSDRNLDIDRLRSKLAPWLQSGAAFGAYGCIVVALTSAAKTVPMEGTIAFLSSLGGNLIASILDRVARGEDVGDDEIQAVIQSPEEIAAVRQLVESGATQTQSIRELLEVTRLAVMELGDMRQDSADQNQLIVTGINSILAHLAPSTLSVEEERRILVEYCQKLSISQHARITAGTITAESARIEDQIREPLLNDVFVEPHLVSAGSLRESHLEAGRLFELWSDEDADPSARENARSRLLAVQTDAWRKIRSGGSTKPASKTFAEHQAVVLLGDPGSGKSTLLRWLLLKSAMALLDDVVQPIPLFIPIGDYARAWEREREAGHQLPLEVYLVRRAESETMGIGEILRKAIAPDGSGVILLLDGLDEVPRELRRAVVPSIQESINSLVAQESATRIVISSRFFGYQEAPIVDPVVQMVVAPFEDNQIRNFARKWYEWLEKHLHPEHPSMETARANAELFEKSVFARPQIADLARNPLMLTMIAVLVRQGKRLPERRVELYDQALRQLMTQWEFQRMAARGDTEPEFSIDYGDACQLWAPIAHWMHEVGTGAVHEGELKQKLRLRIAELEREEKAEDWLTVRGDKCCLLQERGNRLFGFLHQTFQEYLAGMSIYLDGQFTSELDSYIEDPRWHEVLRLACGYLGVVCVPPQKRVVSSLINRILDHPSADEHLLHENLFLAASCTADDVKPKREVEQDIVLRLLRLVTSREMPSIRSTAMNLLVQNARAAVDPQMLTLLEPSIVNDPNWSIRFAVMQWFSLRAGPSPVAYLTIDHVDEEDDLHALRLAVLWKYTRNKATLEELLKKVETTSPISRMEVARIVIRDVQPILEIMRGTLDPQVKVAAARILVSTEASGEAVDTASGLLSHEDPQIRLQAARLLHKTKYKEAAVSCALGLINLESEKFINLPIDILVQSGEYEAAASAMLWSLVNFGLHQWYWTPPIYLQQKELYQKLVLGLHQVIDSPNIPVRVSAAALLLGTEHNDEALKVIASRIDHVSANDRSAVVECLRRVQYDEIANKVDQSLMQEDSPGIAYGAAYRLLDTQLRDEAIQFLLPLLDHPDSDYYHYAEYGLADTEYVSKILDAYLRSDHTYLDSAVVENYVERHPEMFLSLLTSPESEVRRRVAVVIDDAISEGSEFASLLPQLENLVGAQFASVDSYHPFYEASWLLATLSRNERDVSASSL